MKIQELKELSADELKAKEAELRDQLFKLRFQHALGQLDNAANLRTIRKDIARIQTLLSGLSRTRTE
ncbi:MAG: 50S ribosomal protein L29 [Candidatus Aminicenantes bacterium]|nr:50S ribosomal protein L29 [Candidatus Aminicenantes bacterium]